MCLSSIITNMYGEVYRFHTVILFPFFACTVLICKFCFCKMHFFFIRIPWISVTINKSQFSAYQSDILEIVGMLKCVLENIILKFILSLTLKIVNTQTVLNVTFCVVNLCIANITASLKQWSLSVAKLLVMLYSPIQ